jgi:hypothetical protein
VTIHADELIMALENHSYEMQFYLDRQTGEVLPVFEGNDQSDEDRERIEADPDRFVFIDAIPSSVAWEVMETFVESLQPGQPRRRLEHAIRARHPFRTFKDEVSAYPNLLGAWYRFHDQEWLKMAREWLGEWQIDATLQVPPGRASSGGPGEDGGG